MKRIIASISIILVLLFMMFTLTGCLAALISSLSEDSETIDSTQVVPTTDPEIYNTDAENAISMAIPQAPSAEKAPEAVSEGDNIAEMIYQRAYYNVTSVNGSLCTVQVTAPDMQIIYWDAFSLATEEYSGADAEASAEMETRLMNIIFTQLESGNYPLRETTLELEILNGQPQFTYEFADAMYGGMLTVWQELVTAYEEG